MSLVSVQVIGESLESKFKEYSDQRFTDHSSFLCIQNALSHRELSNRKRSTSPVHQGTLGNEVEEKRKLLEPALVT
jgi:hypothetical protein